MTIYAKDPSSTVDYSFDWSNWLTPDEDIIDARWSIAPSTTVSPTVGDTLSVGKTRGVYVSGGLAGNRYRLSCKVTTTEGRSAERSITLSVMER